MPAVIETETYRQMHAKHNKSSYTHKHTHTLSLIHTPPPQNKTTGVVIRAMDRGTDAADTVVTYLFLYLLP